MMQLNDFERNFKKRSLENSTDLDLDQSWEALNQRLDQQDLHQKKGGRSGRWSFGILCILLLGYCSAGLWKDSDLPVSMMQADDVGMAFSELNDQVVDVPRNYDSEYLLSSNTKYVNSENENKSNQEIVVRTIAAKTMKSIGHIHSPKSGVGFTDDDRTDQFAENKQILRNEPVTLIGINQSHVVLTPTSRAMRRGEPLGFLPVKADKLLFQYPVRTASAAPIQIKRSRHFGNFSDLRIAIGWSKPMGQYSTTNSELNTYIKYKNDHLKYLEAINLSATGNFSLRKNLDLGLGIQYQKINQVLEFSRLSQTNRKLEDVVVEIRINPYTQDSSFVIGDIVQEGESLLSIRHYNAMTRWSVPLKLEYLSQQERWGFGLAIGTSFSFSHVSSGRFIETDGSISNVQARHPANVHYVSIEPIVTYAMRQPFVLDFRPHFQQAINNSSVVHSVLHRPSLWGFDLGVRFGWNYAKTR